MGRVVDLNDPLSNGRVKVAVLTDLNNIDSEDIGWAINGLAATSDGIGISSTFLPVNTLVVGLYLDPNQQQIPLVFATIPTSSEEHHDLSILARGGVIKSSQTGPEKKRQQGSKFPYNKTITTSGGHAIQIDDTPGAAKVSVDHSSGSYIEISNDGSVTIKSVTNLFTIAQTDNKSYGNNVGIEANKNITLIADDTITIKASKDVSITGETVTITGGNISLN